MAKYIVIWLFFLISCGRNVEKISVPMDAPSLKLEKGVLLNFDKRFTGNVVAYFNDNNKMYSCSYLNGKKHGAEKKWFDNGEKEYQRTYNNGVKVGRHIGWWSNGNIKFEYFFNDKGEHHGVANNYYKDGTPYKLFQYRNGKEEGSQKMFKPNGNIKANYVVVNGERFGLIGLKKCDAVSTM